MSLTKQERINYVNGMLLGVQKLRSNMVESWHGADSPEAGPADVGDNDPEMVAMFPWAFGPKCILPTLDKILTRGEVDAKTFASLMMIAHTFEPGISAAAAFRGYDLPEPKLLTAEDMDE